MHGQASGFFHKFFKCTADSVVWQYQGGAIATTVFTTSISQPLLFSIITFMKAMAITGHD